MSASLLNFFFALFLLQTRTAVAQTTNSSIVSIPYEYTYLLPGGFTGNLNQTFANSTRTGNATIDNPLSSASKAPFISYDDAFLRILGSNPQPKLIHERDTLFAYEAGLWVPERNEVWFTSAIEQGMQIPTHVNVLNLGTNTVYALNGTSQPVTNPNGGYYFEGKVYFATFPSNGTYRGGVISVDAQTLEVETVVNNYFGLSFSSVDDITWARQGNDRYMFFTDFYYNYEAYADLPTPGLPAGVWRWDPQEQVLLQVISRNEIFPNGVRVSPDMRTLYVTESFGTAQAAAPYTPQAGPSAASWYGPYIYKYDLDAEMFPVNCRQFGLVREGIADGIHVDDAGNVWTGESEGIVVRNPKGKVIGVFNAQYFLEDKQADALPIANFALAGDTLAVQATTRLWTVKLGKTVVSSGSSIVN
ncbi:hypothetical protein LTR85_010245 [Meristemomyces frigidus]|nr:hypothetical protein LTR85_010245 [Meristemomyces frigidus]